MRHSFVVVAILLLIGPLNTNAQYHELGISIGGTQYSGDMDAPEFSTNFQQTRFGFGLFYKYNIQGRYSIAASFLRGTLQADDANSSADWQLERNLSFSTKVNELSLVFEYNIFKFDIRDYEDIIAPYVFLGGAYFRFNPTAEYEGQTYDLQPLGTEGQGIPGYGDKYSLGQFSIPFGGGIKLRLSEKMIIAFEIGARKTFTDYIDDLSTVYPDMDALQSANGELAVLLSNRTGTMIPANSQRGKESVKDYYFAGLVKISYRFDKLFNFGGGSGYGCPTF